MRHSTNILNLARSGSVKTGGFKAISQTTALLISIVVGIGGCSSSNDSANGSPTRAEGMLKLAA